MNCESCKEKINEGFMCDKDIVYDILCSKCFGDTCEKLHEEDCLTIVYSDE